MADDTQKRTLLDQLTTNAATPQSDVPAPLTPALSDPTAAGGTVAPPLPMGTSATTTGSTANLESAADDSTNPAAKAAATAKGEDTGGFLSKLGRIASGMSGLGDPNSSPDAGLGSRVGSLVGRVGNGLAVAAGTPEQKQIGEENSQVPLKLAQIQNEQQYRRAVVGNAMQKESDQYGNGADGQPVGTSRISAGANAQRADNQTALVDPRKAQMDAMTAKAQFELETLKSGQFPIDSATAMAINRPDLINPDGTGRAMSAAFFKSIGPVLAAKGLHVQDIPSGPGQQGGIFVKDRYGNTFSQMSTISGVDARGASYNRNKPMAVIDTDPSSPTYNQPVIRPASVAEAQNLPPVGPGMKVMSQQAQFTDIYSGIGAVRAAVNEMGKEPLDAATIGKLTMAMRETDPTVFKTAMDTLLGSEQLTPAQQDFVVSIGQLNERAMSIRGLANMGNASDQIRAAIKATLPSAKSGDPVLMRKQLDSVQNLIDNLHTGILTLGTSAQSSNKMTPAQYMAQQKAAKATAP